jgi:hypothetical protein
MIERRNSNSTLFFLVFIDFDPPVPEIHLFLRSLGVDSALELGSLCHALSL